MSDRPLVVITTRLPPATCGIGAYSALLREHWPDRAGAVEFLVVEDVANATSTPRSDRVSEFSGEAAKLWHQLDRIGAADVVLHYAGRAYQRFGCPVWLPGVLAKWKQKFAGSRLMIVVHELPGELPMTSRHFWLGQLDAWIVRRLSRIGDVLATNTQHHAETLRRISGRSDVHLLPVGSNIVVATEPARSRAATEFVLFGLPFGRLQTLQRLDSDIRRWQSNGRLTKLHIIGPDGDEFSREADALISSWSASLEVVRHGALPSPDVSAILGNAGFALTNVTAATWSKSGAFMACAAHRCAVVVAAAPSSEVPFCFSIAKDELETIDAAEVDRRTAALAQWYHENADWPVIATRLASLWENGGVARVG
jgi:hypothetical protein